MLWSNSRYIYIYIYRVLLSAYLFFSFFSLYRVCVFQVRERKKLISVVYHLIYIKSYEITITVAHKKTKFFSVLIDVCVE
jgi:hypothetical protein